MKLSLILPPRPNERWTLALQIGVNHAVTTLPDPEAGEQPWDFFPLLHLKTRFEDAGLQLSVIEATPPLERAKLGLPGAEREIETVLTLIQNMGALGIPILCWNWMAGMGWLRTCTDIRGRGGALVTGYDHQLMRRAPLTPAGTVSEGQLWETLHRFLEQVVPVATESGVRLALHPDDPPISPIRGISRILRSPEAMERAIGLVPSLFNGITYCQGTFTEMGADHSICIRRFGREKIHFVHFRDIRGTAEKFVETFHDDGQTDMVAAMRTYQEIGFDGPIRPDHVPTMAGESNERPGYAMLGRLFAIGYMKGLLEATATARTQAGERP
jgi:mannonate dehydratase